MCSLVQVKRRNYKQIYCNWQGYMLNYSKTNFSTFLWFFSFCEGNLFWNSSMHPKAIKLYLGWLRGHKIQTLMSSCIWITLIYIIQNSCETSILFALCTPKSGLKIVICAAFFQDSQYRQHQNWRGRKILSSWCCGNLFSL